MIAIIAIPAAILFPVFAQVREKARQTACLSNEKQLGLAMMQYIQDFDEMYPAGLAGQNGPSVVGSGPNGAGAGWAGDISPYIKAPQMISCPDDSTTLNQPGVYTCSYGLNYLLPERTDGYLVSPSTTVQLFEVKNDTAFLGSPTENAMGHIEWIVSAVGDGWVVMPWSNPAACGLNGDYVSAVDCTATSCAPSGWDPVCDAMSGSVSRHQPSSDWRMGASNYLLADGHAKFIKCQNAAIAMNGPNPPTNESLPAPVSAWWGQGLAQVTWNPL